MPPLKNIFFLFRSCQRSAQPPSQHHSREQQGVNPPPVHLRELCHRPQERGRDGERLRQLSRLSELRKGKKFLTTLSYLIDYLHTCQTD